MAAINLRGPVQSRQEVTVGKVIEDVVDSRVALGCQVALDGLVQQVAAIIQDGAHDAPVKGELDLVETDRRHGQSVDLLPARRQETLSLSNSDQSSRSKNRKCCRRNFSRKLSQPPYISYSIVLCKAHISMLI